MAMTMVESIVLLFVLLMLLLLIILFFFSFKPWRFFFSSSSFKADELERPLVVEDINVSCNQNIDLPSDYELEGACYPREGHFHSPRTHGLVYKQTLPAVSLYSSVIQGNPATSDSLVLDISSDPLEDVGQTLMLSAAKFAEIQKHSGTNFGNVRPRAFVQEAISDQRSCLTLEVIEGPSLGLHYSVLSTSPSRLPLTLGRVSPSDLLIKDLEVSGKHALIKWNLDRMKWELVDMGSLNGTLLNSQPINNTNTGSRHWGDPKDLANGDIITLGTTSRIVVHITTQNQQNIPFGVGMASDPMALRRGGKKLPMEDFCYYQWPLPGLDQFGLFGICDGHGGDGAAKSASKLFPEIVTTILSNSLTRERVLSLRDASDILRGAFSQAEACMNHYYEGCTATVLLVWADENENIFVQCANVGDSSCVMRFCYKLYCFNRSWVYRF